MMSPDPQPGSALPLPGPGGGGSLPHPLSTDVRLGGVGGSVSNPLSADVRLGGVGGSVSSPLSADVRLGVAVLVRVGLRAGILLYVGWFICIILHINSRQKILKLIIEAIYSFWLVWKLP